jgi:hypothetical protein
MCVSITYIIRITHYSTTSKMNPATVHDKRWDFFIMKFPKLTLYQSQCLLNTSNTDTYPSQ